MPGKPRLAHPVTRVLANAHRLVERSSIRPQCQSWERGRLLGMAIPLTVVITVTGFAAVSGTSPVPDTGDVTMPLSGPLDHAVVRYHPGDVERANGSKGAAHD